MQRAFLDLHGFILFSRVVAAHEVRQLDAEVRAIQERWLAEVGLLILTVAAIVGIVVGLAELARGTLW